MAIHDDDLLDSPVPAPDAEASPAERGHARTFAELVDKALAGRAPAAMSADDRALLEVATVIRAATRPAELAPARKHAIVEGALRRAIGGVGSDASAAVTPLARARKRRWVPWAIAGTSTLVAAAAVALLWLRAPLQVADAPRAAQLPASWTSRPADRLIGPIERARSGDASARIDTIFADRLDGYRERRLSARGGKR